MKDYAQFLVRRFAVPHFTRGSKEVHIVFDRPGQNPHTPKAFEHSRRDAEHSVSPGHEHFHFTDIAAVLQKWHDHLNCRQCKRQLVVYLGGAFLSIAPELLHVSRSSW